MFVGAVRGIRFSLALLSFGAGQVIKVTVPAGTCGGSGTSATSTTPGGEQRTSTGPGSQVTVCRDGVAALRYTKQLSEKGWSRLWLPGMAIAGLLLHSLHDESRLLQGLLPEFLDCTCRAAVEDCSCPVSQAL